MKLGVVSANVGPRCRPDAAVRFAQEVEAIGFDSIWAVEHVAVPGAPTSRYPYSPDGEMPGGADLPMTDPLVWFAFVAAHTEHLLLGTGVLILPLNHPVRLAKAVATLDLLSGGRVVLGIGVGWLADEARLLDMPWDRRGRRSDEQIELLRALWRDDPTTYRGEFYDLADVRSHPKPDRLPPIVLGGHSDAAARRAGRLADGYMPAPDDPDEIERLVDVMRTAARQAGRDPMSIEVTCSRVRDLDTALRLADLGVTRLTLIPPADADRLRPRLERFREEIGDPLAARGY